mgnify:CR=1 FL=1
MDYNNINKDISNTNRDEITAAVDFAYKTIDTLALYAREKSDSVIDMLSKVSPNEMCNFGIRNGIYMMRLMRLNEKEKEITLNALGTDAVLNGDSSNIIGTALSPSYAKGYDYVDNFVNIHKQDISSGVDVTSTKKINNRSEEKRENLYYDDNGTGEFDTKIKSVNLNSILNKTKRLFNQHKINTIISRFHTDSNLTENSMDVRTEYGLSHGRNLLTGDAQRGDSYPQNGYDNPYCRVWTHHYQYDSLDKRMRPFMDGEEPVLAEDFHKWENFHNYAYYSDGYDELTAEINGKIIKSRHPRFKKEYGWKDDTYGWRLSVLGKNGFVNITPKFQGGGEKNIHTKQCMFSIENLAWKDYDPYSFEKALSWEQRGPMGGRIMWFPPYGISFNETTSTNWNSSTFIGRGEDVYTYINTVRTGTLNFMLLVDHPSILDYVSWGGRNNDTITKVSDDDVHRFFAGCDNVAGTGGSNETGGKLSDYAKPTPLTDEYIENRVNKSETPVPKSTPTQPTEPQISMDEDIKVTFYVFFPNNYAGYYDRCGKDVEAIPYLLYGKGAQMTPDGNITKNLPLSFENTNGNNGSGYEMKTAISNSYTNNYIIGTDKRWWDNKGDNKTTTYVPSKQKKWYYRIDGEYKMESITSLNPLKYEGNAIINCYDQYPQGGNSSFYDKFCYNLNSDIKAFKDNFNETDNENLYSLSEVAQALASEDIANVIAGNVKNNDIDRINKLKNFFNSENGYKLISVDTIGYSNEHGNTINESLKNARNEALAKNRALTVLDWLKKYLNGDWKDKAAVRNPSFDAGHAVDKKDKTNVSGKTAKMYRSVKVVMHFNREATATLPDANQQENSTINTGENLITDIIKKIEEEVIKYRNETDIRLTEKEINDIDKIISNCVDSLGSNYLENVKAEIKTELSNIKFTEQVDGGKFTLYEDWQYGDDDEDKDDNITALIKEILNMSTVDSKDKMADDADFEQKLGVLIKEDINKLKKVKNKKEELEKIYENYHKDDSKIENWDEAIQVNNQNIERLRREISQIEDRIHSENDALESLLERKKKIEKLEDEKERKHKLNKINKEIEESNRKIRDWNKDIQNKRQEISDLEENNRKLTEKKENTDNSSNDDYKDWQYSQKIDINSDDIDNVINDYFKEGNVEIDDFYRKKIVNNISKGIAPKINCVVRHTVNDINAVPNDVIIEITFDSGCYEIYNNAIEKGVTDGNNTAVNIDKGKLFDKLDKLRFIYNGNEDYRRRYYIFNNKDNEIDRYQLPFVDETVNILSDKLSSYATKEDVLRDINSIKSLLNDEFKKYLYIYIVSVDNAVIQEKTNKVKEILNKYNENMDKSEYVGFSKHKDENTGETYYINENETDAKKKNLKWVEELDKDRKPTGKLVLKYIDGVDTRASVEYDEKKGIVNTDNIKGDFNKSRYDQEYYFFRALKDKDRMTYDKVMEKIQYFDPAFHSMTPEGFSARLNFLNQCMRAGNTVTASDGSYAKSANNLAFGRPPFCVLRLGDWYNQMIVIDNISINYDPLVWDLNEEGIGVIPLIANVSMSFKFIGGGDLGGPVRRLQNAMSFNYYANGRLYDNRSDRMKYNWNDKTCGALKGNEIDTKNSYFYTAQNYKNFDTIN